MASKLAQGLGLHRDSAQWNVDPKTAERRRHLFWDLYANETFHVSKIFLRLPPFDFPTAQSLALGRPPSNRLSYIDTELPDDIGAVDSDGNAVVGCERRGLSRVLLPTYLTSLVHRCKFQYVRSIFSTAIETILTANPSKYETILDLDRQIWEFVIPAHLDNPFATVDSKVAETLGARALFQSSMLGLYRCSRMEPTHFFASVLKFDFHAVLLFLHRSWFAQALLDHPANPLQSPYAPS